MMEQKRGQQYCHPLSYSLFPIPLFAFTFFFYFFGFGSGFLFVSAHLAEDPAQPEEDEVKRNTNGHQNRQGVDDEATGNGDCAYAPRG